jgi:Uma2 family endonuclease
MVTTLREAAVQTVSTPKESLPRLENGDRLTRYEFHRRYQAMPHLKKAELIEGVVFVPSPARYDHGKYHASAVTVLGTYAAMTPTVEALDNATVFLDADNEVQPDILLRLQEDGTSRLTESGYLAGAPELVFEIAGSSATKDLHQKKEVYRRCGVQEYIVWTLYENALYWYRLGEGTYELVQADEQGIIHSTIFPGLMIHAKALLNDDMAQVLQTLQMGMESEEYVRFARSLAMEG